MTTVTASPGSHELSYERVLQAPPDLVYRAFTEPDLVRRWWAGNYQMTVDKFEARPGGIWRYVSRENDGSEQYAFHGVFHDLVPGERIVQTFEYEGMPGKVIIDTITFEEHDGKTTLTTRSLFETVEDRDGMLTTGMETGYGQSLDKLAELLTTLA